MRDSYFLERGTLGRVENEDEEDGYRYQRRANREPS